jgi:hypothetical protein
MTGHKLTVGDEQLKAVTAGGRALLDLDEALTDGVKTDAINAHADAVLAEIERRRLEVCIELLGVDEDAETNLDRARRISADRRRRADGLLKRAGAKTPGELGGRIDMRIWVASQLASLQRAQATLEERYANIDLYAVTDDELRLPRHPDAAPPPTASVIRVEALTGRASIVAHTEWLAAHVDEGPPLVDSAANPARQAGIEAFRRFTGDETSPPGPDDPSAGQRAADLAAARSDTAPA